MFAQIQMITQWFFFTTRSQTCPHCRSNLANNKLIKLNFTTGETFAVANKKKIAELEKRVNHVLKAESDLKKELEVKRKKFQELVENNRNVNSASEKLR